MNNIIAEMKKLFDKAAKAAKLEPKVLIAVLVLAAGAITLLLSGRSETAINNEAETSAPQNGNEAEIYVKELEERLISIISAMEGTGRVKVMITLKSGSEDVYLRNSDSGESYDPAGKNTVDLKNEYVIVDDGKEEKGIVVRVYQPEIRGVAVVCDGGGNESVCRRITEAVTALLDIGSSSVSVSAME